MEKNNYILIFFLFVNIIFSQEKNFKTIIGQVVNDTISIGGIHVINSNSGSKTITVQIKPQLIIIEEDVFMSDSIRVYLEPLVNELESVTVSPMKLSGDLISDLNKVKENDVFNFDDVGIPGFKGERREKIVYRNSSQILVNVILLPVMPLNIDAVYKQLSGYYKNLRKARKLDSRFGSAADIIQFYGVEFFIKSFNLKKESVYEFVIGSMETHDIENDFKNSNHALVLTNFKKFYESNYN